jgi:hypothetical protein
MLGSRDAISSLQTTAASVTRPILVSHVRCSMGFQRRLQQVQTWTRTGPGRSDMVGGGMIWRHEETMKFNFSGRSRTGPDRPPPVERTSHLYRKYSIV